MEKKEILRAEEINKSFPGVKALSDVSFNLYQGEVHVLLGENGAGKSTLMKIFSGFYSVDSGDIYIDGQKVSIRNTKDSQELGISIIYQEFNLVPELTVAQNIFLGREPRTPSGNINKAKMNAEAAHYLEFLKASVAPTDKVKTLGVAQQQLVEIAKALSQKARVLIMDEPTATLSESEIEVLFKTINDLTRSGVSIIYISHRLQELSVIGDRITVLRDGQAVGTVDMRDTDTDSLVRMMVGREISRERVRTVNTATDEISLDVRGVRAGRAVKNVSMRVHKGEIVALSGLVGAGRTELVHTIFGIDKAEAGEVYLNGRKLDKITPHNCIRSGMGLLTESRKDNGLSLILPISWNITQAAISKIAKFGVLNLGKERRASQTYIDRLRIMCPGMRQKVVNLSGGNQQKVVLGKWLFTESTLLIFDEPTRGIDIGARDEIYHLIDALAKAGNSILIISSDLPEVMTIADRIYVMREGSIVGEFSYAEASQEKIIAYASGGKA